MAKTCSCVIPFYNEKKRIGRVLTEILKVPSLKEVVCVDSSSTDGGFEKVQKEFPQVHLYKVINKGKTEAVRHGVEKALGEYILLLDADLIGIDHQEIDYAVSRTMSSSEIDMVILKRTNTPLGSEIIRSDLIFSGERIVKKTDLDKILALPITKYQLEIATNQYMTENKKKVYWYQCSNQNTPKVKKIGWLVGYIDELKMKFNVVSYNPVGYCWQILFFCRKKAPF